MPFEPCPTCGYALSIAEGHCRHCAKPNLLKPWTFKGRALENLLLVAGLVGIGIWAILAWR